MAVAAIRAGAEPNHTAERLQLPRLALTQGGIRDLGAASGWDGSSARRALALALGQVDSKAGAPWTVVPTVDELRRELGRRLAADPHDLAALEGLAAQGHPADADHFAAAPLGAGRRASLVFLRCLGWFGEPGAVQLLARSLTAVDDPGHGFAARAAAADSLGMLGLASAERALVAALEAEALDHEGRPGAGLGIQRPVRAHLLRALGECGGPGTAAHLVPYLASLASSALGGLHLPAMDALCKLGQVQPLLPALSGPVEGALNAVGVLAALGALGHVPRTVELSPELQEAVVQAGALEAFATGWSRSKSQP